MSSDQYSEEAAPQIDSFDDESSPEKCKRENDAIVDSHRSASSGFDCNICLDCVQDPVVTLCGHLYCWPCIYQWLNFHTDSSEYEVRQKKQCPVCKSEISQSSLVPLYGRGQTSLPSKGKDHRAGFIMPKRPLGPSWVTNSPRSYDPVSDDTSEFYRPYYRNHPRHLNSIRGSYAPLMLNTGGSLTSGSLDPTYQVFGEMVYARVFGNQITNLYTYPNSYNLSGISNPRIRRHLMQADKSLGRISFFLLCCAVLCLLLF